MAKNRATGTNTSSTTGEKVGEGVGGVSGAAAGAAIGTVGGPIGVIIGGIAGAVGGWWAGREIGEKATGYDTTHDTRYRQQFETLPANQRGSFRTYDEARPAYQLGYLASQNPDYRGRSFDEIEPDLRRGWDKDVETRYGAWNDVRDTVRGAYHSSLGTSDAKCDATRDEARMTRAEEELAIGKRQVRAGEVGLHKTVETEHVHEKVPLMHEEIEVERHPVNADSAARDLEIGEQDIRVPLTAEEAVVQKRVVAKEEVVVSKRAVQDTKDVEADLRKERVEVDKQGRVNTRDRTDTDESRAP